MVPMWKTPHIYLLLRSKRKEDGKVVGKPMSYLGPLCQVPKNHCTEIAFSLFLLRKEKKKRSATKK